MIASVTFTNIRNVLSEFIWNNAFNIKEIGKGNQKEITPEIVVLTNL